MRPPRACRRQTRPRAPEQVTKPAEAPRGAAGPGARQEGKERSARERRPKEGREKPPPVAEAPPEATASSTPTKSNRRLKAPLGSTPRRRRSARSTAPRASPAGDRRVRRRDPSPAIGCAGAHRARRWSTTSLEERRAESRLSSCTVIAAQEGARPVGGSSFPSRAAEDPTSHQIRRCDDAAQRRRRRGYCRRRRPADDDGGERDGITTIRPLSTILITPGGATPTQQQHALHPPGGRPCDASTINRGGSATVRDAISPSIEPASASPWEPPGEMIVRSNVRSRQESRDPAQAAVALGSDSSPESETKRRRSRTRPAPRGATTGRRAGDPPKARGGATTVMPIWTVESAGLLAAARAPSRWRASRLRTPGRRRTSRPTPR
jgi:hypothetical protein